MTDTTVSSTVYTHSFSGATFTATGEGPFGAASVTGTWDSGKVGTIWPAETWIDGSLVWLPQQIEVTR